MQENGGARGSSGKGCWHPSLSLSAQIRDARALDVEALCIVPGERVWAVRADVRIVDLSGNAPDACALAAIAAL